MQADAKELRDILQDLERHLAWQASDGSKVLLAEAEGSKGLVAEPVGATQPPAVTVIACEVSSWIPA